MQAFFWHGRPFGKTHEYDSRVEEEEDVQGQDYKEESEAEDR
jgi:hypothetical protein